MAERMTRDEHIARAEELLAEVDKDAAELDASPHGWGLDPERDTALINQNWARMLGRMQIDTARAAAHLKLAEVLGLKNANEPRPDDWKVIDSRLGGIWSRTVNGDVWLLRQFPEGYQGSRHSAGWWIRSVDYPKGCWVGYTDDPNWEREKYADRFLHSWYGECCKDDPTRTGPGWGPCQCRACLISSVEATA